ncbi:MAG: NAD-binding protein [Propionibacteriales bacterium]|nr:NAD-binding protein [Propionibacteriales bacterium]
MAALRPGDTIGFVGIGNMGTPMTRRLLDAGYRVRGYDARADAGADLDGSDGFTRAGTLAEVIAGARAVILMLPDSTIVAQVLLDEGLLDAVAQTTTDVESPVVIDMSSSQPEETVRLAAEAESRGVRMIDAPVSGGVPAARDGSLTVMVGGPEELGRACEPALEQIGRNVVHCGPIGAGHALKALNNLLSASHLIASSEALVIGTRFGLDPQVMMDAINGSSGRSWSTLTKWPRYVLPRTFDSGFLMSLLVKDTKIALGLARSTGVEAAHATATLELWSKANQELSADADHTDIHRWVEQHSSEGG